jgi:hypothetical protein
LVGIADRLQPDNATRLDGAFFLLHGGVKRFAWPPRSPNPAASASACLTSASAYAPAVDPLHASAASQRDGGKRASAACGLWDVRNCQKTSAGNTESHAVFVHRHFRNWLKVKVERT